MAHDSNSFTSLSRRSFLRTSGLLSLGAATVLPAIAEPIQDGPPQSASHEGQGIIRINANENPLGPCDSARKALAANIAQSGRYDRGNEKAVAELFAKQNGLDSSYVSVHAGSFIPLHFVSIAFSSPTRSIVSPRPTFDAGFMDADRKPFVKINYVPLRADHTADVEKMVAADPEAGIIYLCNPNNPTGTVTKKSEILYALANKPKNSILLIDEAYIHFSDAESALDLVAQDKDVIVLRTFSKIYGLAGLRCGLAAGRPDLLAKLRLYGGNPLPNPALVAALASLEEPTLVADRKKINATIRDNVFDWMTKNNYEYIPSQVNFFMVNTGRPGVAVTRELATRGILIGGTRPLMDTWVRVSIGTQPEMDRFKAAYKEVIEKLPPLKS
jgi:histidinol-phosphate aminotransferase